jgi:hypothetical protein
VTRDGAQLCPECGAPTRGARCASCGHAPEAPRPLDAATVRRAEAAWRRAERATLAFLGMQVALRAVVVAQGSGSARAHLVAAAVGAGVILGVHRALVRRNEPVLLVWSWVSAIGAVCLAAGTALWWTLGAPTPEQVAVSLGAAALTGAYAWFLRRSVATIEV